MEPALKNRMDTRIDDLNHEVELVNSFGLEISPDEICSNLEPLERYLEIIDELTNKLNVEDIGTRIVAFIQISIYLQFKRQNFRIPDELIDEMIECISKSIEDSTFETNDAVFLYNALFTTFEKFITLMSSVQLEKFKKNILS